MNLIERDSKFYISLFENFSDPVIIMDLSGIVIEINQKALDVSGFQKKDIIGKRFNELKILTSTSNKLATINFQKKLKGEIVEPYEVEIVKRDREIMPAEISSFFLKKDNKTDMEVVVIHDLTERKMVEKLKQVDSAEYEAIFNSTANYIIFKDKDDKIIKVNQAFVDFMGLPKEKLIGKTTFDVIKPAEVAQKVREEDLEVIRSGKPKVNIVSKLISAFSQKEIWGRYTKKPYYDESGEISGTITYVVDITENIKFEEKLKRKNHAFSLVSKCNQILLQSTDESQLMKDICNILVEKNGYAIAWVGLAQKDEAKTILPAAFSGNTPADFKKIKITWSENYSGQGPTGQAIRSGKTVVINNYQKAKIPLIWRQAAQKYNLVSAVSIPLKVNLEIIGALTIYFSEQDALFLDEVSLLEELAGDLAFGINNLKIKKENDFNKKLLTWQRDLALSLHKASNLADGVKVVIKDILTLPDITSCGFYLVNPETGEVDLVDSAGLSERFIKTVSHFDSESGEAKLVALGKPVFMPYLKFKFAKGDARISEGLKALAVIPIIYENKAIAVLNVASKKSDNISDEVKKFLELAASYLGDVFYRFEFEDNLKKEKFFSDQVIESIPGIFYVVNAHGQVFRLNLKAQALLNLVENSKKEVFFPNNLFQDFVGRFLAGESEVELSIPLASGENKIFYLTNKEFIIDENKYLICVGIDRTEQKKIEDRLHESNEKFSAIAVNALDSIFTKDSSRRYTYVNPAMQKIFKMTKENILGKTPDEIFSKEMAVVVNQVDDICFGGKIIDLEKELFIGGVKYTFHVIQSPIKDNQGKVIGISGIVRDITALKKTEIELRESEERLKIIFENAPDAIILYDFKGKFIDGNLAAEKLSGYKKEELIGKSFLKLKLLAPNQLALATKLLSKNLLGQPTGPDDILVIGKNGKEVNLEILSYPVKIKNQSMILAIARDTSQRKLVQEEMKRAAERYQSLFNVSRDLMVQIDRFGTIIDINDAVLNYGYNKEKLIGKKVFTLVGVFGKSGVMAMLKTYKQRMTGQEIKPYVLKAMMPNGKEKFAEITVNSLKDKNNKVLGALIVLRDVTEQLQATESVKESFSRYQMIFNSSSDIIIQTDISGKIIDINQSIERYGYNRKEMLNKSIDVISSVASEQDSNKVKESFAQRQKGKKIFPFEITLPSVDKSLNVFEVSATEFNDSNAKQIGFLIIMHDLTERKHNEEIVRSVAGRYKMLFDASHDILIQLNAAGLILDVNQTLVGYGYKRSDFIGNSLNDLDFVFSASDLKILNDKIFSLLKDEASSPFELFFKKSNNIALPMEVSGNALFDDSGNNLGSLLVFHDVSERKKAEKEILEKIKELERLNKLMIGRELKMTELKDQLRRLQTKK